MLTYSMSSNTPHSDLLSPGLMQPTETAHFHRAFPNPALTVPYESCLQFSQFCLKSFPHGGLKAWMDENADKFKFSYTALISLKKGKQKKLAPLLVQRILAAFGFVTDPVRLDQAQGDDSKFSYAFQDKCALDSFTTQLAEYKSRAAVSTTNPLQVAEA
jgi:hypothetical protein